MRRTTRPSIRVSGAVLVAILFVSWQQCLAFFTLRGRVPSPRARCLRRAEDQDTMGELFTKYYRLQEVSSKASTNTCNLWAFAVVSELLEILDDLERGASQDGGTGASSSLKTLAKKFEARLQSLGFQRIEAQGQAFDPSLHEAAAQRPAEGLAAGQVCEELRRGWMLEDRVVRPAVVTVAA
eukprot:g26417.t2